MLKRSSGTRQLPIFHENNNLLPINVFENGNNNIQPNSPIATSSASSSSSTASSTSSSPVMTRSAFPAMAVRKVKFGTKHTANVRNTARTSRATIFGKQKLETLRVNRRSSRTRRNTRRSSRTRRN